MKCKKMVRGEPCPECGGEAWTSTTARKKLDKFIAPSLVGLLGVVIATHIYRPLDSEWISMWAIVLFFLPVVPHLIVAIRKRVPQSYVWLRGAYLACGVVLLAIAAATSGNGVLDSGPVTVIEATILRKNFSSGRSGTTYVIWVPSWRQGRSEERLEVGRDLYRSLNVGQTIRVPLHGGALGLPWYGIVSPR